MTYNPQIRQLHLPNGFDVFGFDGWLARLNVLVNTDVQAQDRACNLPAGGFLRSNVGGGTFNFQAANPIAGRPKCCTVSVTNTAGDKSGCYGVMGDYINARLMGWPIGLPNSYTKLQWEATVVPTVVTGIDYFLGWTNMYASNDPWLTAGSYSYGIGYQSGDANWSLVGIDNSVITKTSIVAVAINNFYDLLVSFDGVTLSGTVNGTSATKTTGLPSAANAAPGGAATLAVWRRSALGSVAHERAIERYV